MTTIYGIPNCDTMKKARKWLDDQGIDYHFHNFKKAGLDEALLLRWTEAVGWEKLLNKRGMMWRKLDQETRDNIDKGSAIRIMLETPSIIKRPVLDDGKGLYVGFIDADYREIFGK
ncbi:MAG: ArsC family transcriptional regulator [Gammaproteobacteria bacterium (ex Lamellibrachia satsuma)]|nr:MAG: ArsC family reductase [Gammaproteobacteria bacterium (ex Lamellibrachia satsuma)]RRS32520.1 MAG: ArsC family transcriptional regulator [Gammaproteobacteria bacterium (ex Lamellibrachia satsuma)]RRS36711.1 MAG: ArsC family transcriptional regulator [Gammaproteobacteria bacterium (ex Lamellibrachia satsuma)]